MGSMLRLLIGALLVLSALLAIAIGLARHTPALTGPAHLILLILALLVYVLPSAIALHRNCSAIVWIIGLNILLGWTVLGWVLALGWAAGSKQRPHTSVPVDHAT